jgi:hypothetical protein
MKYFRSDKNWEFNSRIFKDDNKWTYYGEGYRLAIEILEKQVLEIDRTNQDFLIYPFCFLIRHYIEIRLKEIIDEGNKILKNKINPSEGGHNLSILWQKSQQTLKETLSDEFVDAPKEVYEFILEIHSIDVKSENFRYPIDKRQIDSLIETRLINFKVLAITFGKVKTYLDGITDWLSNINDR